MSTDANVARSGNARAAMSAVDGLPNRQRRLRWLTALIAVTVATAVFFLVRSAGTRPLELTMTAGDALGHRHALAESLAAEATKRRLTVRLIPTSGSEAALDEVAAGRIGVALVQGGLEPRPEVRQVASLVAEPLHLLVRPALLQQGWSGLRGAKLNVSTPGSGTRRLALEALARIGLKPADFTMMDHTYAELAALDNEALPDGLFLVSALPSALAEQLIQRHGYRLMPLPFGQALALRDAAIQDVVIPEFTYGVNPAVPPEPVHTLAPWLAIVAHRGVSDDAVLRLLEATFDGDFALRAELTGLSAEEVVRRRELPLHPATHTYLHRNQPAITGEFIESVENARSFLVSALLAVFLAWRWYRGRGHAGFERYLDDVTRIELDAQDLRVARALDAAESDRLERRLTALKSAALEQYASGRLSGEATLAGFLTHVADVRQCLRGTVGLLRASDAPILDSKRAARDTGAVASPARAERTALERLPPAIEN